MAHLRPHKTWSTCVYSCVLIRRWFNSRKVLIESVQHFKETIWSLSSKIDLTTLLVCYFIIWQDLLLSDVPLCRSCEDSGFMEDFSDMLLLKLLHTSITAADDNEKVCALYGDSDTIEVSCLLFGIRMRDFRTNVLCFNHFCSCNTSYSYFNLILYSVFTELLLIVVSGLFHLIKFMD